MDTVSVYNDPELNRRARSMARDIRVRIKEYIQLMSCGDEQCTTCKLGVAIGLKELDAAFNAGSKVGQRLIETRVRDALSGR